MEINFFKNVEMMAFFLSRRRKFSPGDGDEIGVRSGDLKRNEKEWFFSAFFWSSKGEKRWQFQRQCLVVVKPMDPNYPSPTPTPTLHKANTIEWQSFFLVFFLDSLLSLAGLISQGEDCRHTLADAAVKKSNRTLTHGQSPSLSLSISPSLHWLIITPVIRHVILHNWNEAQVS